MHSADWRRKIPLCFCSLMLCGSSLLAGGCAVADAGKSLADATARMFTPNPKDYMDDTDQKIDEWSSVGSEGRGDRARDRESDGLTGLITSQKAQGIERNLGVD